MGYVVTYVAMKTHGDVERLMRRPYHRTLWTFFQLKEHDRFAAFEERARALHNAGLLAIAFHEPKRLADEYQQLQADMGAARDHDDVLAEAEDVIEAMRQINEGTLKTTVMATGTEEESP